jgi:hypothetical protein
MPYSGVCKLHDIKVQVLLSMHDRVVHDQVVRHSGLYCGICCSLTVVARRHMGSHVNSQPHNDKRVACL